jgi:5'-deoxynucleotidase
MRNLYPENVVEHSYNCAVLAHALAVIRRDVLGKTDSFTPETAACAALYHDVSEILTGDMPTPVKYYEPGLERAYKSAEVSARDRLVAALPEELRPAIAPYIHEENPELHAVVKAADKLCALIKCIEERRSGNREFLAAETATREKIDALIAGGAEEVRYFAENILPSYELSLDELGI